MTPPFTIGSIVKQKVHFNKISRSAARPARFHIFSDSSRIGCKCSSATEFQIRFDTKGILQIKALPTVYGNYMLSELASRFSRHNQTIFALQGLVPSRFGVYALKY